MDKSEQMPKFTITEPADWIEAVRRQAKRDSMTMSRWIYEVGVANLDEDLAKTLGERRSPGRPPLQD